MNIQEARRVTALLENHPQFERIAVQIDGELKDAFDNTESEDSKQMIEGFICEVAARIVECSKPIMDPLDRRVLERKTTKTYKVQTMCSYGGAGTSPPEISVTGDSHAIGISGGLEILRGKQVVAGFASYGHFTVEESSS